MRKDIIAYYIKDVDCTIDVEVMTKQKDVFDWLNQYIDNMQFDWFDASDESFEILYKDGTTDIIDCFYDGHKIRKNNIVSMVYNNPEDYIVYGSYEINEYGVVHTKNEKEKAK